MNLSRHHPFFSTEDESNNDGDAAGAGDTMDRKMPPHNAKPGSGKHQERVTNIIDLSSSTDTSSTVSPTISNKKWDIQKKIIEMGIYYPSNNQVACI